MHSVRRQAVATKHLVQQPIYDIDEELKYIEFIFQQPTKHLVKSILDTKHRTLLGHRAQMGLWGGYIFLVFQCVPPRLLR